MKSNIDFAKNPMQPDIDVETQVKYTRGLSGEVTVFQTNDATVASACTIMKDEMPCNSCDLVACNDDPMNPRIKADCTNIEEGADIDLCTNTGLVGIFEAANILEQAAAPNADSTLYSMCDEESDIKDASYASITGISYFGFFSLLSFTYFFNAV